MENNLKFSKVRFWSILILILVGIGLCVELGYIFYKTNFLPEFATSFCSVSNLIDCDGVAQTQYAVSMGVPNALWGLILYCVMLMLLFVDKIQAKFKNTIFDVFKNPRSYIAFLGLLSFVISMVLAFISIFKINKICALCFVTYFINLFIALLAKEKGFFINEIKTTFLDFIDGAKKHFILFIVVLIAFVSTLTFLSIDLTFSPKLKREKLMKEFMEAKKNKYAIKGNVLGNKNAKVIVNVYSDYNCPFCRVVNIMLHKIARECDVLINEINYPIDNTCNPHIGRTLGGHEASCIYSRYALAAKKQGKFWGMADILFYQQPKNDKELEEAIENSRIGLDYEQLKKDINSIDVIKELMEDIELTYNRQIQGTPAIEINGVIYMGSMPYEELKQKIKLAEKRALN